MTKILLVEDDKSLREIYGVRLLAEGYDIVSAGDGEEALAMAIKERPGLIISDVMMPKISGFDMLDILRSTTETRDIKVVMMTALSSEDQRERGQKLGADRYLVKSQVGIEDVVRTVHEVLGDLPGTATSSGNDKGDSVSQTATPLAPHPAQTSPSSPSPSPQTDRSSVTPPPRTNPSDTPQAAPVERPSVSSLSPERPPQPPAMSAAMPTAPQPTQPAEPPAPQSPPQPPAEQPSVAPAPQPETTPPAATPTANDETAGLPQPTAPFSSQRPANLGDRVIHPINDLSDTSDADRVAQMIEQELSTGTVSAPTPAQPAPEQPAAPAAPSTPNGDTTTTVPTQPAPEPAPQTNETLPPLESITLPPPPTPPTSQPPETTQQP